MIFAPRLCNRGAVTDEAIDKNETATRGDPKPENDDCENENGQNRDEDQEEHASMVEIEGLEMERWRLGA